MRIGLCAQASRFRPYILAPYLSQTQEKALRRWRSRTPPRPPNSTEQEMEIRKQLKLLRPGETTFILEDPPKAAPRAVPQP